MNYSSYPSDDDSKSADVNLLYNQKKNNRLKPPLPQQKKKVQFIKKKKTGLDSLEHFSNPPKKKISKLKKDLEKDDDENLSPENDESDNEDETTKVVTEEKNEIIKSEAPKSKTFLGKIISGALSLIFLILIGLSIYVAYMYFIKKKNIFSLGLNLGSNSNETPNVLTPSETEINPLSDTSIIETPLVSPKIENTPPLVDLAENTSISSNEKLENLEMTGGDEGMVYDIINILKKFQN